MIYRLLLICCSLFFLQCARPIAEFTLIAEDATVPAIIKADNLSQNADSYIWVVDDSLRFSDQEFLHTFFESGRHEVELQAIKGSKSHSISKELVISPAASCRVLIETTLGDMTFELSEDTPAHLDNFVSLVESGFYEGLIFHRVIENFMIQGGDHKLRRNGVFDEPQTIPAEIRSELPHYRGALAAARMPDDVNPQRASSGSQFYVVHGRSLTHDQLANTEAEKLSGYSAEQRAKYLEVGGAPQLDEAYTVFGYMLSGFDVLDKIAAVSTDTKDKPKEKIKIIKAKMLN